MGKVIDAALNWILSIARDDSHGYDQSSRWGPDYDCSSLVISAYRNAGVPLQATYTGNMWQDFLAHGFEVAKNVNLATGAGLLPGDVLLNERNHTAMYIGNGQVVHASGNEHGGATGGQTGDQTGREISTTGYFNFPWDVVLRYTAEDVPTPTPTPAPTPTPGGTYTVQDGDSLWSIAERFLGSGLKYPEIMAANGLKSSLIYVGQVLRIPGSSDKKTITVTIEAATYEALRRVAETGGASIGEVIDQFFSK